MPLTLHPAPTTDSDRAPEPEPPAVVTVSGVPAVPDVVTSLVMERAVWVSAVKVKDVDRLVIRGNWPSAAFVAHAAHLVGMLALRSLPLMLQPTPDVE